MSAIETETTTILIVDDDRANREALEVLLRPDGYLFSNAATGKQALASVANKAPDLILLDVTMPDMDGFAVASKLKADPATAAIPIIMITAHTGRGWRIVGLETGVEDYVTKPIDPAELPFKVRNLLRFRANAERAAGHRGES
jgi:DNA-binding response OmpR family regulator